MKSPKKEAFITLELEEKTRSIREVSTVPECGSHQKSTRELHLGK